MASAQSRNTDMEMNQTTPKKDVRKRFVTLEEYRSSWRSHWAEISDYVLPRRGRYLQENQSSKGRKRSNKIIDNTAGQALRTLSAGMVSGLTSPSRPWFRLQTQDAYLMDQEGVKDWLGTVEMRMRSILSGSNFYNTAATQYTELGAFGTAVSMRVPHPTRTIHFRSLTAGEYVIAENWLGDVDTVGRKFMMTASQIVEQFLTQRNGDVDWSRASNALKNAWNRGSFDTPIEVVHMVQPRRDQDRDMRRLDGKNKKYADIYFEVGADTDTVLREEGYDSFPYYVPRWDVTYGDVYGFSPAMEQLGDIKQLQHEQKRKAQAIDKMVNPPMVASTNLKGKVSSVMPAGVTYVDPINGGAGFQPAYQVQPRIQEMLIDIQEVQGRIQRGFYADLFAMMLSSDRRQITATEVAERHEEKLVLLGPVLQRVNTEYLDPMIDDLFNMALKSGTLPPPPEALQGAEIKVKYVSLLAQAQEAVAASSIERTVSFAGNMAAVAPDILDNINTDEALRQYSDILGNGPELIREPAVVAQIRAERLKAQQQAQQQEEAAAMAQTAQGGAQAAKLLSETDSQGQNALTALMGGGG